VSGAIVGVGQGGGCLTTCSVPLAVPLRILCRRLRQAARFVRYVLIGMRKTAGKIRSARRWRRADPLHVLSREASESRPAAPSAGGVQHPASWPLLIQR
jgi:hypothetical protein